MPAYMTRLTLSYWRAAGRRVPKDTPGARQVRQKSDYFYACFPEGRRVRRVKLAKDRKAATKLFADLLVKHERGQALVSDPKAEQQAAPLADYLATYLADLTNKGWAEEYVRQRRNTLNKVFRECGWRTLRDMRKGPFVAYLMGLGAGAARKNALLAAVVAFTKHLQLLDVVEGNPFAVIPKLDKEAKRPRRALSEDELAILLQATYRQPLRDYLTVRRGPYKGGRIANPDMGIVRKKQLLGHQRWLLYKTAVCTGLRRKELAALRVSHLDLPGRRLELPGRHTKNRMQATMPLPGHLAEDFSAYLDLFGLAGDAPLFRVPGGRASMTILRNNLRLAGVPEADAQGRVFNFHSFRKCTATLLFGAGVGARIVSVYLRHASANLTEHYDDVTQRWDELVRAAATLPKFDPLSRADLFDPDDENWCPFDPPF